jgi:hypothetical protein
MRRLMTWAVPDRSLLAIGFVPGCACEVCVPACPLPALRYLNGVAA